MKTQSDRFLSAVDRLVSQVNPLTVLVDSVLGHIIPQTDAKACHPGGSYVCHTSRGSICYWGQCVSGYHVYNEIVAYGHVVPPDCIVDGYCTNSCAWVEPC
jgi:hypothetical protein